MFWEIILFVIIVIAVFIISLISYLTEKRKSKVSPEAFSPERLKYCKTYLIISSVILGIIAAAFIALYAFLLMAVAFM